MSIPLDKLVDLTTRRYETALLAMKYVKHVSQREEYKNRADKLATVALSKVLEGEVKQKENEE